MLEVRFLGTFAITMDGQPVILSSRAAQSLFAYLILTAGTSHRREKLAGMFWADATEEKARAYLRHELWRIRKLLPAVDYIFSNDMEITVDSSKEYWLDVDVLVKSPGIASAEDLMTALSGYKGELLPGFYDEWVIRERERLQAIFEQNMMRLLDLLEREKRWIEMLKWSECWISLGQGPEAAYRSLLSAYTALGDLAKVVSSYERCVRALAEIGLEPSEETRAFMKQRSSKFNIPIPRTSFVGRENGLRDVTALLSNSRLVTLTGSGGVGKTRLAIQVVADVLELFPDGVWFLDLAPVSDPVVVPVTLAEVLDLRPMGGSDLSYTDLIISYLSSRRALIIFDNCEHVIEPCAQLVDSLLTSCEYLSILATSREALRLSGETPYRVPSLQLPGLDVQSAMKALQQTESVRLFMERASAISPRLVLEMQNALIVVEICRRLDGIPLAIELAAARINVLSVQQILDRLDDRFNLLTGGSRTALPRHKTLRATIEWSYDLLSQKERLLFQRLAIFTGGWTLEAAEAVCSGNGIEIDEILDLLSQLVYKSLILVETLPAEARYHTLESIRQFAYEKLGHSGKAEPMRAYHLSYFLNLAQQAELEHPSEKMLKWMEKIEQEYENFRAAMEWSLQRDITTGQKLVGALAWFWTLRGSMVEGYDWLKKMLAANPGVEPVVRAKLLSKAGWFASLLGYSVEATSFSEHSLSLYRQLGDKDGIAFSLYTLGTRAFSRSDLGGARSLFEESCALAREQGSKLGIARALTGLGLAADAQGDFAYAQKFYEERLMLVREMGHQHDVGSTLYFMGVLASSQGDSARAMELYSEALQIMKVFKNKRHIAWILDAMGSIAISSGSFERSRLLFEEAMQVDRQTGNQAGVALSLHYLACGAFLQGDYAQGRTLYIENLKLLHNLGNESDVAEYIIGVGLLLGAQGDLESFARLHGAAVSAVPDIHKMVDAFFRAEIEKTVETARSTFGDDAYPAAWEKGRQMNLEAAIAYALQALHSS